MMEIAIKYTIDRIQIFKVTRIDQALLYQLSSHKSFPSFSLIRKINIVSLFFLIAIL